MKRLLFLLFIILLTWNSSQAQKKKFDPNKSYNDISFTAGIYTNAKGTDILSEGTVYSLDYGRYSYNGFGTKGGISYIDALDNNINAIQIP